ncbi:serine/threonine transporter SstT [Campylobacter sp. JMF_01 NE2]|uniref:serine/threonine transporter SstT n=1 Tax=unclassified Campylobacter TaxID=2593542 RepID=UPI0022E9E5F0|nr:MULTISPECIES: serine/threonine transporter SstT [unclassified Campylobacter]MDA3049207.1 serine/threonine transporter SstT [Campylobacter sp. JMF_15 NE4]MDA3051368.1 serine/threonine transporter SstT [Campylobacter sp. JMF_02 ED1]MDA3052613.1 serine/threonine transporter SstT [Campylobacter sp. JMF_03 NE3]MDA3066944.1 serine/threonine transporter SstT [Campylobacter sp. JMF_01 NE2]MDA3069615.1 serine/threonine transporter SstT [Campylobacter sp. VBCF_08 NA3]
MTYLDKLIQSYSNKSLIMRIIIGLLLGAALGYFARVGVSGLDLDGGETNAWSNIANLARLFGDFFVSALKAVAPVLVFILILSSLVNKTFGSTTGLKRVIVLYIVGTLLAAFVGVGVSFMFPTPIALDGVGAANSPAPANVWEVLKTTFFKIVDNPVNALSSGNYVGIVAWAVGLGIALKFCTNETKRFIGDLSEGVTKIIQVVIQLAPIGIFGIITYTVYDLGVEGLATYAKLTGVLVLALILVAVAVNPLIVFFVTKKNPFPIVFTCLKESGIPAFFTRSSAANIPVNMNLCKKLGVDDELSSISIPLGATVNMAGAAVVIAILALSTAYTLGIHPDFGTALLLCVVSAVGACGTSGVPGGSLMLIPLACALFGIDNDIAFKVITVGVIISVIQDSMETALNSSTDALFTIIVSQTSKH